MNEQHQQKEQSKKELKDKELKDKIDRLAKTVREIKPRNREEAMAAMERTLYMANIHALKVFLIDRNCEGEKPRLIVESAYTDAKIGIPEDRIYLPYNEPKYHQDMLDMLKKQQLVPDDGKISDYAFLFEGEIEEEKK
jgi:hypothetical protein